MEGEQTMNLLIDLFLTFLKVGVCSIGGGYATIHMIQQEVVQAQHWLSAQEYLDMITLSQMTPGPIAVNTSTFAGMRTAGFIGAIVATVACVLFGVLLSLCLYHFFQHHRDYKIVNMVLTGLKPISTGLILSSAVTIILLAFFPEGASYNVTGIFICIFMLILIRKWKLHPMLIIVMSGVLGAFLML